MNRRTFFKAIGAGTAIAALPYDAKAEESEPKKPKMASIIDITLCDGCDRLEAPRCVLACREKNTGKFPEPREEDVEDYSPRENREDWSKKRDVINRLTPYNWTYIESVIVGRQKIFIPRRCMHCNEPVCRKLCPFGVISKEEMGAVKIDPDYCFGGGKCRDVCPWGIPQRQVGIGIYTRIAPRLIGGGAMYKCDMCTDVLSEFREPPCAANCPRRAIMFGEKRYMLEEAERRARTMNGYFYGMVEAGGTATYYVSKVSFEEIDKAIKEKKSAENDKDFGRPNMPVGIKNPLRHSGRLLAAALIAPVAAVAAAAIVVHKDGKKNAENDAKKSEDKDKQ
ncbi:MAG: 4Fe-4S dicluster domain-containing protein [Helicobacteraceae bacterium]|jgi:Fe-S-cluster-containing dehydrogenase component|nr:4Fe-4S dicluster domain-containing protein [Helicobacteraceae bacterium]